MQIGPKPSAARASLALATSVPAAPAGAAIGNRALWAGEYCVYVMSSQACTRTFLGKSQCAGWRTMRFTASKG